ncbi:MAG: DUF1097 domain-containing protein [Rikenellaceae bacterium]
MKFSKFIIIPIMIAILAAIVQLIDQVLQSAGSCTYFIANSGFGWLTFQAWALYFLAGCNIKGGVQVLIAYIAGIIGSIAIIAFAGWLGSVGIPGFWVTPLSLLILVIPVICLERVQVMIPGLFVGAGAYFAIMTFQPGNPTTYVNAAGTELVYCLVGLIFGWITVTLRVAYENSVTKNS